MRTCVAVACLAAFGCKRKSDQPAPEPPGAGAPGEIPPDLTIAVEVDGQARAPIDAARLAGLRPDYMEGDKRAWRLSSLIGPTSGRGVEVEDKDGVKTTFPAESDGGLHEPMLYVNHHGDILVAMMSPTQPFPPFHGRGGNRGRPGDPAQRIHGVRRIRVLALP